MAPRAHQPAFDVAIVGAGILGLATARQLAESRPDLSLVIVEKEREPARHQSGRNSGVIHSGLYYRPGSNKATMVARGRQQLLDFCATHDIAHEVCGKVVVASTEAEAAALGGLAERGRANGLVVESLSAREVRVHEPCVEARAGLFVPATGIADFAAVARALSCELAEAGHQLRFDSPATDVAVTDSGVTLAGGWGSVSARVIVNCAGLHADRVARLAGADTGGVRIMPFRGEYYQLSADSRRLVRNLVYPVPDPAFPFLGVHFTRTVSGEIHVGPNAVPALRREGYAWRSVDLADLAEILSSRGTWSLARQHWRTGAAEVRRSLLKRAFWADARRLLPEMKLEDLERSPSGVRAQAITREGVLVDDFVITTSPRAVHVVNAPSPAATASFEIGAHIARLAVTQLS